jgi:hypothetical protein
VRKKITEITLAKSQHNDLLILSIVLFKKC